MFGCYGLKLKQQGQWVRFNNRWEQSNYESTPDDLVLGSVSMYHWCFILSVYCSSWHFQEKDHLCVIGQTVASLLCQSPSWWSICNGTTVRNGTCVVCAARNMRTSTTSGLIPGMYRMRFPSSGCLSYPLLSSGSLAVLYVSRSTWLLRSKLCYRKTSVVTFLCIPSQVKSSQLFTKCAQSYNK